MPYPYDKYQNNFIDVIIDIIIIIAIIIYLIGTMVSCIAGLF